MKTLRLIAMLGTLAGALVTPPAAFAGQIDNTSVGVQLSTLGYGASFSHALAPRIEVRLTTGYFQHGLSGVVNGINYNGSFHFDNVAGFVDVYPARSFHVSAGLFSGSNRLSETATLVGNKGFLVGGQSFTMAQIQQLHLTAGSGSGSYVGVGTARRRVGIGFVSDLGITFHSVSATVTGTGPASGTARFQSASTQEDVRIQNQLGIFRALPKFVWVEAVRRD